MPTEHSSGEGPREMSGWSWTPASMRLALLLILFVGNCAFWLHPAADPPPHRGIESRLVEDGLRPLDSARALAGESGAPSGDFGPLLVTLPAWAAFSLLGVSIGSAKILAGLSTLILAFVVGLFLARRYGDPIGILGALLVVFHGATFAWARSPTVIPLVQLCAFGLILLAARRERTAPWLALSLTSIASVVVHPTIWFIAPALVVEGVGRLPSVRDVLARMPFLAMVLACATVLGCLHAIPLEVRRSWFAHFGGGAGETPSLLAVAPALLPFAWYGFLIFLTHVGAARGGTRSLDRLIHGVVWIPLAAQVSVGSVGAAASAELLPFLIWLALASVGSEVRTGRSRSRRRRLPLLGARGAFFCIVGVLGTLWLAGEARSLIAERGNETLGWPLPWIGVALVLMFGRPRARAWSRGVLVTLAALIFVVPGAWEAARVLGYPQKTLSRLNAELGSTLLPTAHLEGEWARALTLANDVRWGHGKKVEHAAATHRIEPVLIEAPPSDRRRLPLDTLVLLGHRLELARLDPDHGAWSAFEEGRDEERRGRLRQARLRYFLTLRGNPDHSPSWERIARILVAEGDTKNAYRCYLNALHGAPDSPAVQEGLARLYLEHDHPREAAYHLQRAGSAGASGEELAPLWELLHERELR